MKYTENTTLLNLDKIDYKKLKEKIDKSSMNIELDVSKIEIILKYLKNEFKISQSEDIDINIYFVITNKIKKSIEINILSNKFLMPHLSPFKKSFTTIINLDFLRKKDATEIAKNIIEDSISKTAYSTESQKKLLKICEKIEELLDIKNEIKSIIYKYKLNYNYLSFSINNFKLKYNNQTIQLLSKATLKTKSNRISPIFDIDFDITKTEGNININILDQQISLTTEEFLNLDNKLIEYTICNLTKLKGLDIENIDHLKNYLLIEDIKNI